MLRRETKHRIKGSRVTILNKLGGPSPTLRKEQKPEAEGGEPLSKGKGLRDLNLKVSVSL